MLKDKIIIYTDGAARGNPGKAGWGVIILFSQNDELKVQSEKLKVIELGGRSDHATNNQMELQAAIESMKYLKRERIKAPVEIFADSKYVILGITEWIENWMKNNWRNAAKKPVLNKELWQELYELDQEFHPKWSYVKGHSEHVHNDRADLIATSYADGEPVI